MLENMYLVAGIVAAIAAVIGLFINLKGGKANTTNQAAHVSGQRNKVIQSIDSQNRDN